jgi:DNA ligase 1
MHPSRSVVSAACLTLLLGSALLPTFSTAASALSGAPGTSEAASAGAAPALMLAGAWPVGHSPRDYLVSEKLDGVRAFWDGQSLRFRSGRAIAAPGWFIAALPKTALDGELWLGRGRFDELSGIVRRELPVDADWHQVRYMIFDVPGGNEPFAARAQTVERVVAQGHQPWLQAVPQQRVADASALQVLLKATVQDGGEGLVLHRANALWSPGRSDALLKLKLTPDEDARVVAHLPGKGRNAGKLGALLLEMPNGQRFALGTGFTDAQRDNPPAIGSLVTYRYRDRTPKRLPRFASFLRVRSPE